RSRPNSAGSRATWWPTAAVTAPTSGTSRSTKTTSTTTSSSKEVPVPVRRQIMPPDGPVVIESGLAGSPLPGTGGLGRLGGRLRGLGGGGLGGGGLLGCRLPRRLGRGRRRLLGRRLAGSPGGARSRLGRRLAGGGRLARRGRLAGRSRFAGRCRLAGGGLAGGALARRRLRRCAVVRCDRRVGDGGGGGSLAQRVDGVQTGRLAAVGLAMGQGSALAGEDPLEPPLAVGADFELRSHHVHPLVYGTSSNSLSHNR